MSRLLGPRVPRATVGPLWPARLLSGAAAVLDVARKSGVRARSLQSNMQEVAVISRRALGVRRTSVWMINAGMLECSVLVDDDRVTPAAQLGATRLRLSECAGYVGRLYRDIAVAITDTRSDPSCEGLLAYLNENGVGALLDVPLVVDGELRGVICHEHVGGARLWTDDELLFCNLVASVILAQLETERRVRAELRANGTEARYAQLVESLPVVVYAFDVRTGALDYVSPNLEALTGLSVAQWIDDGGVAAWLRCIDPADKLPVLERFRSVNDSVFQPEVRYRIGYPDGRTSHIKDRCSVVRDRLGRPQALHGTLLDISAEVEVQRLTQEHARRLRDLLEHTQLASVELGADGRVRSANAALQRIVGRPVSELVGADWFERVVARRERAAARAEFEQAMRDGQIAPCTEVTILSTGDDERRFLFTNTALRGRDGGLDGIACLGIDLTERDRLAERVHHAQRVESLGALAAGVAHDFNNLLQVISLAATEVTDSGGPLVAAAMRDHAAAVGQARSLAAALLQYTRRDTVNAAASIVVDDELASSWTLLARACGSGRAPVLALGAPNGRIRVGAVHFLQVMINLMSNAGYAMQGRPGMVEVSTLRRGDALVISVRDEGVGVPAAVRDSMFEPFVTTKASEGTGLGLAMVHAIVRRSGGHVEVESELGVGTTIRIVLPTNGPDEAPTHVEV